MVLKSPLYEMERGFRGEDGLQTGLTIKVLGRNSRNQGDARTLPFDLRNELIWR